MSLVLNGSGTITGLSAGGLPDSSVTTAELADAAVTQAKLGTNVAGTGPAFAAYANASTSTNNATFTKVALGAEYFDTASCFSSSRFTPNVAGFYQVNWGVRAEGVNLVESALFKNGSSYSTGSTVGATSYLSAGSDLVYMNGSTDYIELYVVQYSGSSQNISGSALTRFSGFLARAA